MDEVQELVGAAGSAGLEFLLIGGNALRLQGYLRNTIDVDFLIPDESFPAWKLFLEVKGYTMFHAAAAFAQFESPDAPEGIPVDLMRVTRSTWSKLRAAGQEKPMGKFTVILPCPEHLVALKLHAATSPQRSKPAQDWEDIRQLVRIHHLDPHDSLFRQLILRYGNEDALERIEAFHHENTPP